MLHFYDQDAIKEYENVNGTGDGIRVAGDVTDEEIQYVSWWFRTNRNPKSLKINWKNFFIQEISSDYDRKISPDGKSCDNLEVDNSVLFYEYDENGKATVTSKSGEESTLTFKMNQLQIIYTADGESDHVNNFNDGTSNDFGAVKDKKPQEQETPSRNIMLFKSSGIKDFLYQSAYDPADSYNRYVLVNLKFKCTPPENCEIHKDKCNQDRHTYNGLYLAFDYEAHVYEEKEQTRRLVRERKADGFYSNWIFKISSANPEIDKIPEEEEDNSKSRRIMCEDLGTADDFDFNDLVFDVYYTQDEQDETKYTANITVQASGGTLPIYIGEPKEDESNEAHHILGAQANDGGKYDPIINKGGNRTSVDITIPNLETTNPDNVEIYVVDSENNRATRKLKLPTEQGGQYENQNPDDKVPQKICVPVTIDWTDEHQQIEDKYPGFRDWVTNHKATWWIYEEDDEEAGYKGLKWSDGTTYRKSINIKEGEEPTIISFQSDEHGHVTASGYNRDIVKVTMANSSISVEGLQNGSTTVTLTQVETGETLTLEVTVENSDDGKTDGEVDYKELYGTPIELPDGNPIAGENGTDNIINLIEIDKINVASGDIIITFVYDFQYDMGNSASVYGMYYKEDDNYSTWVSDELENVETKWVTDATPNYNIITLKCNVGNLKQKYKYLNSACYNGNFIGAYCQMEQSASSAKKRTIRRK